MQSSASKVEFEAFNDASISNADVTRQMVFGKDQHDHHLQKRLMELPHAGSVGSIVSKLPFSTVVKHHQDTVGVVRFVCFIDNIIPDATKVRIYNASVCKRILLIKVPHIFDCEYIAILNTACRLGYFGS
jgi:hypothetical protein